jgi:hypothetical protein
MASAKKLQAKLFGNGTSIPAAASEKTLDPNLTLNIPKVAAKGTGTQEKSKANTNGQKPSAKEYISPKSYRQFVLNKLGTLYEGVERYRLDQDAAKEKHWKRWGPYLSERQWVILEQQMIYRD